MATSFTEGQTSRLIADTKLISKIANLLYSLPWTARSSATSFAATIVFPELIMRRFGFIVDAACVAMSYTRIANT
ncbi:hypothetical protein KC19_VG313800 [Ceratodon purpureus]|uniref:Uncharacterized protein n=1 Tax=Ceratodon purpureus TaxID=3225 RepID=A0A8T0HX68_CERPU|nr:hypothetical protein KC19_VG313800 [Ceratodon purpureus]